MPAEYETVSRPDGAVHDGRSSLTKTLTPARD